MTFLIQQTLIYAVPLMIVALAGVFAERSGIINLALEGIMIFGAFIGVLFVRLMQGSQAVLAAKQAGDWVALQGLELLTMLVAAAMAQFTSYAANEVCYMLVFPYFVFSLGLCEKPLFKGFGRKTELSYGIYLYGFFVQQCLVWLCSRLGWTLPYWGLQVVSIALTMACAYLSAKLIEEPCMRLSKRLLARIPARGERATTH